MTAGPDPGWVGSVGHSEGPRNGDERDSDARGLTHPLPKMREIIMTAVVATPEGGAVALTDEQVDELGMLFWRRSSPSTSPRARRDRAGQA